MVGVEIVVKEQSVWGSQQGVCVKVQIMKAGVMVSLSSYLYGTKFWIKIPEGNELGNDPKIWDQNPRFLSVSAQCEQGQNSQFLKVYTQYARGEGDLRGKS